jgi:hypothetical protein
VLTRPLNDGEVACGECGQSLDEPASSPMIERKPCPSCGSLARTVGKHLHANVEPHGSLRTRVIASAVAGYYAGQIFVDPPRPHDALHPAHHHGDVAGGVLYAAFAVGALGAAGKRGLRFVKRVI